MNFKEAFNLMKDGYRVKRKHWGGYWVWENNTIMIYCRNGEVLDIRDTGDVKGTIENALADDWIILTN